VLVGPVERRGEVGNVGASRLQALAHHRVGHLFLEDAQRGQDLIDLVLVQGRQLVGHADLLPGGWARRLSARHGRTLMPAVWPSLHVGARTDQRMAAGSLPVSQTPPDSFSRKTPCKPSSGVVLY